MEYYILSEKEKNWYESRMEDKSIIIITGDEKDV